MCEKMVSREKSVAESIGTPIPTAKPAQELERERAAPPIKIKDMDYTILTIEAVRANMTWALLDVQHVMVADVTGYIKVSANAEHLGLNRHDFNQKLFAVTQHATEFI